MFYQFAPAASGLTQGVHSWSWREHTVIWFSLIFIDLKKRTWTRTYDGNHQPWNHVLSHEFSDLTSVGWWEMPETPWGRKHGFCLNFHEANPLMPWNQNHVSPLTFELRPMENHLLARSAAIGIPRGAWMNARPSNSIARRAGAAMMLAKIDLPSIFLASIDS